GRASTQLALHANGSVHQLRQALANGQPKPAAAEWPAGGGIDLKEILEQLRHAMLRNADSTVVYGDPQTPKPARILLPADFNRHLPFGGELHGVPGQIEDNLPNAHFITVEIFREVRAV